MRRLLAHVWRAVAIALAALTLPAMAQYADLDRADWREDTVPPPPAYSTSKLIDIEMPRSSSVRMGIDPETISINHETGIVRYVVVARGPSAVNASYEGIRCATGEYRVYARQVQGNPWSPSGENDWKSMRGQTSIMVQHPFSSRATASASAPACARPWPTWCANSSRATRRSTIDSCSRLPIKR